MPLLSTRGIKSSSVRVLLRRHDASTHHPEQYPTEDRPGQATPHRVEQKAAHLAFFVAEGEGGLEPTLAFVRVEVFPIWHRLNVAADQLLAAAQSRGFYTL
jgi:hypothetical protein